MRAIGTFGFGRFFGRRSEIGHERPAGSDGSRTQSRKPEPENKKGHVTNFEKSILCNIFDSRTINLTI